MTANVQRQRAQRIGGLHSATLKAFTSNTCCHVRILGALFHTVAMENASAEPKRVLSTSSCAFAASSRFQPECAQCDRDLAEETRKETTIDRCELGYG